MGSRRIKPGAKGLFHGPGPAWREGVDFHVGQNDESVACAT